VARSSTTRKALTARVWGAMFDFLMRSARDRLKKLSERGLTPNDSRALTTLDLHEGKPMRALAEAWACDPSYATWIVDRLERLGLAERRLVPHDRRVKLLTPKGERTRRELLREFHVAPAELRALTEDELRQLDRVLAKIVGPGASTPRSSR
jgi:DNA-binding MarR family transcriptional regulator